MVTVVLPKESKTKLRRSSCVYSSVSNNARAFMTILLSISIIIGLLLNKQKQQS